MRWSTLAKDIASRLKNALFLLTLYISFESCLLVEGLVY